jgi:hypothetical protein
VNANEVKGLGAPRMLFAPEIAYRKPDVYRDGVDTGPRSSHSYAEYSFIGRYPAEDIDEVRVVRSAARTEFGPHVDVFRSGKWWVIYAVD